jgi:hypothetical protein
LSFCPKASVVCERWVINHIWVILAQVGPNGQLRRLQINIGNKVGITTLSTAS